MLQHRANLAALTVLELLVTITVIAVLAGTGIPPLRDAVFNARRAASLNALLSAVHVARSTALTRNVPIVLCQSTDLQHCADAATDGTRWIVTAPAADATVAAAADPLRRIVLQFAGRVVSNRAAYTFRPFPQHSTNGTISFCDQRGTAAHRAIVVSPTGRPRLAAGDAAQALPACTAH